MRVTHWVAAIAAVSMVGCKKDGGGDKAAPPPGADAALVAKVGDAATGDAAVAAVTADAAITDGGAPDLASRPRYKLGDGEIYTAETFEKIYVALEVCPVGPEGMSGKACPEWDVWWEVIKNGSPHAPEYSVARDIELQVATKLLGHAAPSVRYAAVHTLFYRNAEAERALVADAVAREQDPMALRAMADIIADAATYHPKLAEQVLRLADHAQPEIRRHIADGLGDARGIPGAHSKLAALAELDADADVRQQACRAAGELGDPEALALFRKLLVVTDQTQYIDFDYCLAGLFKLWADVDNTSKDAYQLSLELLSHGPFPKEGLFSQSLQELRTAAEGLKESPAEWKTHKFLKLDDVKKALIKLASNPAAGTSARESATDLLVEYYGAGKRDLVAIRKTLPKVPGEDVQYFAEKLDAAVAAAK